MRVILSPQRPASSASDAETVVVAHSRCKRCFDGAPYLPPLGTQSTRASAGAGTPRTRTRTCGEAVCVTSRRWLSAATLLPTAGCDCCYFQSDVCHGQSGHQRSRAQPMLCTPVSASARPGPTNKASIRLLATIARARIGPQWPARDDRLGPRPYPGPAQAPPTLCFFSIPRKQFGDASTHSWPRSLSTARRCPRHLRDAYLNLVPPVSLSPMQTFPTLSHL